MPISILDFKNTIIGKIAKKFVVKGSNTKENYYRIYYEGQRIARTHCSHGSGGKEINKNVLGNIKRQLLLDSPEQLNKLKDCSWNGEDYFNLLKQKNFIKT